MRDDNTVQQLRKVVETLEDSEAVQQSLDNSYDDFANIVNLRWLINLMSGKSFCGMVCQQNDEELKKIGGMTS